MHAKKKITDLKALLATYLGDTYPNFKKGNRGEYRTFIICCKVEGPGRLFLHRLYALQEVDTHPKHLVRLNMAARADIIWWHLFVERWNGISLLWDLGLVNNDLSALSDASGSWGCAAFQDPPWFQLQWNS